MKKIFVLIFAFILSLKIEAAFLDIGTGARPMGMGGAFTAISDDENAIFWNSSVLVKTKNIRVGATYSKLFMNVDEEIGNHSLAFVVPVKKMFIGIGGVLLNSDNYKEHTYYFSKGYQLWENFSVGISLKVMQMKVTSIYADPIFSQGSYDKMWFSEDISFFMGFRYFDIGFALKDSYVVNQSKAPVDTTIRPGIAYKFSHRGRIAFDYIYRDRIGKFAVGVEDVVLGETFGLRAGFYDGNITIGGSVQFGLIDRLLSRLDFSYMFHDKLGCSIRNSLSIQFK